jgi:predicted enzyme related to lactoylglutathione lyase
MRRVRANPVVHLELHTGDLPAARDFCAELLGWRAERVDAGAAGSYAALDIGRALGGGIVGCDAGRPLWLPYVEVSDVTSTTERARSLGASVLLDPRDGPAGRRSVVATPAAGEIAFWQSRR